MNPNYARFAHSLNFRAQIRKFSNCENWKTSVKSLEMSFPKNCLYLTSFYAIAMPWEETASIQNVFSLCILLIDSQTKSLLLKNLRFLSEI